MESDPTMFKRILIANRGAVAARVQRAVRALGATPVIVHSEADADLPYVRDAEEAHCIGPAAAMHSYLDAEAIIAAARRANVDAVHPGYGFLSEKASFAQAVEAAGMAFIGPRPDWLDAMGHKTRARALMAARGMPVAPSSEVLTGDIAAMVAQASRVGFPLLVKPAGGGGGIGMIAVTTAAELAPALEKATSLAQRTFACADVYVERLMSRPRHVEIQILADRHGHAMHLFERDCSVQRRHQKVIEEAGAPGIDRPRLDALADRCAAILADLGYDNIGTVESLYDSATGFSFLEMNTRLQVEHGVTEEVTGVDIVQAQIRLAAGALLAEVVPTRPQVTGHALQMRIYAEDPVRFLPSPGMLDVFALPDEAGIRVETGYAQGCRVTPYYDPLLAKLIVHGSDRADAIARARAALAATRIEGVKTNIAFLDRVLCSPEFIEARHDTHLATRLAAA
jgi:acetyl-CoA carboxylase, biotin carboxylase subunit